MVSVGMTEKYVYILVCGNECKDERGPIALVAAYDEELIAMEECKKRNEHEDTNYGL